MHRRGYTTQLWVSTRGAEPTRFSNTPNLIGERTSNFVTPSVGGEFSDLASYKCRVMLSGQSMMAAGESLVPAAKFSKTQS
jgi:hypothetical protein